MYLVKLIRTSKSYLSGKIIPDFLFGPQSGRPARPFGIKGEDVGYARLEERIADAACKMQESRKSEIQELRNTGIQECRKSGTQESGIQASKIIQKASKIINK